ncbi:hypothetical protein C0995_011899 [Termitomyces sp. Mi166|nr:hypothetical protein C0995_011899 [Termitomyces sp. Mi166\
MSRPLWLYLLLSAQAVRLRPRVTSTSKHVPLATPPRVVDRLSTIEEHSSGEEGTRHSILGAVPGTYKASHVPSYAPSVTTPLPVLNSTIQYAHGTPAVKASAPAEAPPLPVPNPGTKHYMSDDDDDGDPLQTPPPPGSARWELVLTDYDGLTTPPAPELSPLVLDRSLLPSFEQASASVDAYVPSPSAIATAMEAVAAQPVPSAVEYSPTPVAPPKPDPASEPALNSRPEELKLESEAGPELVSTYPTPVPSLTVERQVQRETNDDSFPDGTRIEDAGEETQTETDATSVISSHPAAIMYTRAEVLRNEARAAEAEHIRLKSELKHIHGVKVLFLKQQMQEQEDLARRLHDKAAKRFFKARNDLRKRRPHEVDVHGLRVAEAVHQTEQALRRAYTNQAPFIRVIVGKGLHSAGKPILKDAITRIMAKYLLSERDKTLIAGVNIEVP